MRFKHSMSSHVHKQPYKTHTYQDVKDKCDGPGRHHAEHSLPPVPLTVDKHQAHVLEVAHGSGEELHQGVGQAIAGQHFNSILFNCGYAPVEGLEKILQGREMCQRNEEAHKRKFSMAAWPPVHMTMTWLTLSLTSWPDSSPPPPPTHPHTAIYYPALNSECLHVTQ